MTSNGKLFQRQRSADSLDEPSTKPARGQRSIWIKENFQKRECSRFIPKTQGQDICSCGQIKELHTENSLLPPALQDSVWVPSRHTVTSPTDAFGEIEFHGAGHYSRAKFIRLSHDTDPELVYDLLCNEWNIGVPKLLISVTGGAKNFVIQPKLKRILRHGLLKAAQITGAWLITGGTNTGVMKHIGEAVRGHTVMSRGAQLKDRADKVHLIGIASWGIVNHRDKLVDAQDVVAYHMSSSIQSDGACLDNNHSHFILVDNGTKNQYGVEISFRANLESCIARKTMLCERSVPVVLLVLEGGPNTIRTVLESVTKEPTVPVVIAEGSGRAADILAFAHRFIGPGGGEMSDVGDVVEHRQLLYKIEKAFPEVDCDTHFSLYKQVLKCVTRREFITVFCVDEGDMDKAILRALLKGQRTLMEDQLSLALVWNRPDIAKSEIFSEDYKWKSCELEKAMMAALQFNHVEFVELLLENGVSMSRFLTEKRLEELYRKTVDSSRSLKSILQKCKVSGEFRLADLSTIMDFLVGLSFKCGLADKKEDSFIRQSMNVFNAFVFSPASKTNFEPTVAYKFPFKELMVWAVLCNRQEMARFMWERGEDNLAKALIAGFMLQAMAKEMSKDDLLDDLCDGLDRDAKYFYDLALGILDECFRTNEATTDKLLTYNLEYWGCQTNLSLAVAMKHKEFVAHSSCQSKMTEIWTGAIRHDNWSSLKVLLGLLFPPFMFTLDYKTTVELSVMPCTFEDYQAEQVREMTLTHQTNRSVNFSNNRSDGETIDGETAVELRTLKRNPLNQVKNSKEDYVQLNYQNKMTWARKFYEFHRAPITKFWANLIVYFVFLALFSYVILLKLEPFPKPEEWVLIGFVLTLLLEEIRQIVQSEPTSPARKIKEWASNNWNICDGIAILLFFVAVGLRFHLETLDVSHVIYSVDIMLWIIRLLDIFSVNKNLGPYVVMIGRMTVDMAYFLLIMVVFLMAYGVAQQAILYPNQSPTWELIPKIFFRPYFQVYGELFIEDIDYSSDVGVTEFGTPKFNLYAGRLVTFIMAIFLLVANILLLNLLIAIFNNTFEKVQANANQIWKFQRYELIMEYAQRPLLVPPFIVLAHIYRLLKYFCKRKTKDLSKSGDHKLKLFLCKDELYKLMLFEEQCTESYLQKRAKMFHSTQEERVRGIADRVELNACEIDKLVKAVQSVDGHSSKLEEYTLQILDVVGHLQLSIPGSISECGEISHDCDEHEMSLGPFHEGAFSDRYTIQNDHVAPVLDRMISMPAYMHQKTHTTGATSPLYFRNKLPLTNPYQYRKQFNTHGAKTKLKRAISRFRRNTLPKALQVPREKRSQSNPHSDDNEDGVSVSSSVKSMQRLKKADSVATSDSSEALRLNLRPRSSSMPSCSHYPNEFYNMSRDHTLHIRARQSPYPRSTIQRYPVPDFLVDWQMPFPGYFPLNHSDPAITADPPWADVDISAPEYQDVKLNFNTVDNGVDRRSHIGFYDLFDGLPRNPMGRTGLGGRGLLGRWGPNHAADPIVTRWMKNENGDQVRRTGKRVLEFVAIQRRDCKQWAIPGGMIDVGETISQTLKREFCEEAMSSLEHNEQQKQEKALEIKQFFTYGAEIYKGYVDDPRNTDNAWMETVAMNFHDESGSFLGSVELKAGDDACNVRWQEVSSHAELYANHAMMLQLVAEHHGAYF